MLYDTSRARGTMAGEAASLMNPEASVRFLARRSLLTLRDSAQCLLRGQQARRVDA